METFLHEIKQNLKNSNASSNIRVVLGNEACDLDSAVSALVMAYYLHKMHSPTVISIPVLNVVRKDLALRNEVVYFLEETHIPINSLICLDEINLKALSESENFTVTLVDHNLLSDEQTYLVSKVVQIIDHHSVDCEERLTHIDSRIEEAGSCCSLVADIIFNSNEALMDPQIAMLLYGTIILDTVCLQESAKRVKEIDRKIVSKLEPYLEGISREEIFGTLRKVKFDVSKIPVEQLLQKDTKYISNGLASIAIASLPMMLQDVLKSDIFLNALDTMIAEKNLMCIILLGSEVSDDNSYFKRQIAVFDKCPESLDRISNYLLSLENPSLCLQSLPLTAKNVKLFDQGNSALSRKFVLPMMQTFLKSDN